MNRNSPTIRILISSPGDVAEERATARRVIANLQRSFSDRVLQPVFWEDLALPATDSFQKTIDAILARQPIDIALFIFWSRLGSELSAQTKRLDGSIYRSGTEREFELMLSLFEQSNRQRPHILTYVRDDEAGFRRLLSQCPAGELESLIAQRKLVEAFLKEWFHDAEGRNIRAHYRYREPVGFAELLQGHLRQALLDASGGGLAPRWLGPPYRGLEYFDIEHAEIFHGRDEETCDLLQRLRDQERAGCAFAVIVGASGSGKSSLARAGVASALKHGVGDCGVKGWRSATLLPSLCGGELVPHLVQLLAAHAPGLVDSPPAAAELARGLAENPRLVVQLTVLPALKQLAQRSGGKVKLLLVIDQFEELWTDPHISAAEREAFLAALEALGRTGGIAVLATIRSDFYAQAQQSPIFLRLKGERGHFDLLPPSAAALRRLISEPARLAGFAFETDPQTGKSLDERIVDDAARDPTALPLVQYALSELYQLRDEQARLLTFDAYRRLGGIEGALGLRANEIFRQLPPEARQALPELIPLLVTIDTAGDQAAVRRRSPLVDLKANPSRALLAERLIQARFLVIDGRDEHAFGSLAHEALLRRWDQIAQWIQANREYLRLRARIEQSQQQWEQQDRDASLLLPPGLRLEEAKLLLREAGGMLSPATRAFIDASIQNHRQEERRKRRRRTIVIGSLGLLALVALAFGVYAWLSAIEANHANNALQAEFYSSSIVIAEREISLNNDVLMANRRLEGVVESARGWEWHYLRRLRDCPNVILSNKGEHTEGVYGARFSPDGKQVATCSIDGTVKLWDAETGALQRSIDADPDSMTALFKSLVNVPRIPVMAIEYSPDGTSFATGGFLPRVDFLSNPLQPKPERDAPGAIRIWDVSTGKLKLTFTDQKGVVLALAYSPDGKQIASSSITPDRTFVVWDANTAHVEHRSPDHSTQITELCFSRKGTLLAAGETSGRVNLYDAKTLKLKHAIPAHGGPVMGIAFSPQDDRLATAAHDGLVRIWNAADGALIKTLAGHMGAAQDVKFSPDGSRLASAGVDKTVRLWDPVTGQEKMTLRGHTELIWSIAYNRAGDKLVSASFDKTARIWDASPFTPDRGGAARFEPNPHTDRVNTLALGGAGKVLASGGWDKSLQIWDAETGAPRQTLLGHTGALFGVAVSPDGKAAASASWDHTAKLWDLSSGECRHTFKGHSAPVHSVCFSPDGQRVASAGFDGQIKIWRCDTGAVDATCDGFLFPVYSAVFSPDGAWIASGGADRELKIWDAKSGRRLAASGKVHAASIHNVRFSRDGTKIATGSWDHFVRIWRIDKQGGSIQLTEPLVLRGHTDRVNSIAFSDDGKLLASGSEDKWVRVWDVETGDETAPPQLHRAFVWSVLFRGDDTLISGVWDADEWIRSWKLPEAKASSRP